MAVLRLDQVTVERDRAKAAGSDPVPDGTHVWLDVPGGTFEWNHFTVTGGRLVPDQGTTPVPLDTRWRHWSIWSPTPLTVPNGGFQRVAGAFGAAAGKACWPLPSRFERRSGASVLVLPNVLPMRLRTFDLSRGGSAAKAGDLSTARTFYEQLLVELVESAQPTPTDAALKLPWQVWRVPASGSAPAETVLATDPGPNLQQSELSPQPDLGAAPWAPTADALKTITVMWFRDFLNVGGGRANAQAFPVLRTVRTTTNPDGATPALLVDAGKHPHNGQKFKLPPGPVVLMRDQRPLASTNSFAHELCHCLTHDPGLGRQVIEGVGSKQAMLGVLAALGVEGPPPAGKRPGETLWDDLYVGPLHGGGATNLMSSSGGTELLPWQVAVIRAARELEP